MKSAGKLLVTTLLLLTVAFAAAAQDDTPAPAGDAAKPARVRNHAQLRVLHAIPGAPAVDVYVDGQKVLSDVNFKDVSEYLEVFSGKRKIKLTAAGQTEALLEGEATVAKDKIYMLAAHGTPAKPMLLAQNEATGKSDEKRARVRVYHLVADAPAVDVTYPSTRTKAGYASFSKGLEPGKTSTKLQAAGPLTLQVRAGDQLLKEMPDVNFEATQRYAVLLIGTAAAPEILVVPSMPLPAAP